ncbi:MAG: HAMP domain-containing protein [Clostridiales bacterium]|nr:HAMP domain-containing protein [Clostridiales bacterium]
MNKRKLMKTKKLSTTLIIFSVITLVILNLISAFLMSFITGTGMNKKQDAFLQQTTTSAQKQTEQFVEKYIDITEMLAYDDQLQTTLHINTSEERISDTPNFQNVITTLQKAIEKYPDILGIGFGSLSEDYLYTQEGKRLDVVLSERPYFSQASKGTFVTQPYIDTLTGEMCVSVTTPVKDQETIVGILILDLKLTQISDFLDDMSFGNSGHIILLSADNTIIGYENHDMIGKSFLDLGISGDIVTELDSITEDVIQYDLNNESKVGIMMELTNGGWKLLSSMSSVEYNAQTVKTVMYLVFLLFLSTIIVAIAMHIVITKKLQPIQEVNNGLKKMSDGNLEVTINYHGDDEIGEMAASMRNCLQNLSSYVKEIDSIMEKLAQGDLTVTSDLEFKGDFVPIQQAIFKFIDKLTQLMTSIFQASEQVSSGSEQVSSGSQALAQGATEQASSVEELAATITALSEIVKSNSDMAQMANQNASRVNSEIEESGIKMTQSLELMEDIRSSANKVSGIVKTIEDIAFQTNILALNAAVEAARAGQAGKGFAVVADEVRNLAAKSAEASKATTDLIGSMLSAIENGSSSMRGTKQYMDNVVTESEEVTTAFHKISEASKQQATSISQVTQGIDQISSVVQTNSATAEQSAAASEELSSQAQMLRDLVSQFKLHQTPNTINNVVNFEKTLNNTYPFSEDKY